MGERKNNELIQIDDDLFNYAQKRALEELGYEYGKCIINLGNDKEDVRDNKKDNNSWKK